MGKNSETEQGLIEHFNQKVTIVDARSHAAENGLGHQILRRF